MRKGILSFVVAFVMSVQFVSAQKDDIPVVSDSSILKSDINKGNLLSIDLLGLHNRIGLSYEHLRAEKKSSIGVNLDAYFIGYKGLRGELVFRKPLRRGLKSRTYFLFKMGAGGYAANTVYLNKYQQSLRFAGGLGLGLGHRFFMDNGNKLFLDIYAGIQAYMFYSGWTGFTLYNSKNDLTEMDVYGGRVNAFDYWKTFGPGSILDLRVNLGFKF